MDLWQKYSMMNIPRAPDAPGAAPAAPAAPAAAPAAASPAAAPAAPAAAPAAPAAAAPAGDQGPWYKSPDYGFDADTTKFYEGKNYPDLKTALTSLRHADEVARSRNVIEKPDATKWKDWKGWNDLGYQEDFTKYDVAKPTLKDGQTMDAGAFEVLRKSAHANKVLPAQAAALFADLQNHVNAQIDGVKSQGAQAAKDLDTKLRGDWKDNYDKNVTLAKRAMKHFAVNALTGAQMESMVGSPLMVQIFHQIGEAMGEDKLVGGGNGNEGLSGSEHPNTIEAQLNKFENDPDNRAAMNDQRSPRYREVTEARRALIKKLADARARTGQAA